MEGAEIRNVSKNNSIISEFGPHVQECGFA
jgi:hypothetical protein